MKYIKKFNENSSDINFIMDIEDILLELTDIGFEYSIHDEYVAFLSIKITKNREKFKLGEIFDVIIRLRDFDDKTEVYIFEEINNLRSEKVLDITNKYVYLGSYTSSSNEYKYEDLPKNRKNCN